MRTIKKLLNDLLFVFPVMLYYICESLVVGMVITSIWLLYLSKQLGHPVDIGYIEITSIYWIFKMIQFDVFKLISGLSSIDKNDAPETDETDEWEEAITE